MACKEREIQSLRERVVELERQLAEAQAAIQALTPLPGDQTTFTSPPESQEEINSENLIINDAGVRQAIYLAPYPLMIRRDDGQVVMINAAWTRITGYTLEDIPTIDAWTRKAYGQEAPQVKSLILNEGFSQDDGIKKWGEFEVTTRTGEKRIWDFSTAPLGVDQNGRQLVLSMAVDITERKQVEEKLLAARDEAAWLARFPAENPNPVVRVSTEGTVLYCNSPAASLRGWRCVAGAVLSRPLLDLVELAVEQGQPIERDIPVGDKVYSVSMIPVREQEYLNLYGKDITERKQAEKALEESERRQREIARLLELDQARLATILRHLPVGVWIMDQQGRLIGNNEQADRIWAGEAPLLNSPDDYQKYVSWNPKTGKLLEPEEYPTTIALRTGQPVEPVELKIRRFDGTEGTVLASAVPIKDNQGLLIGVVRVDVDISDRKKAEAHINDLLSLNEKILNHSSVGILTYKVSGQCVFANEKVASIMGTSVADLLTQNFHMIAAWKKSGFYDLVQQAIAMQALTTADIHHISTFGKEVWVTVHCITFQSKGEEHVLLSISDITERKNAEEALRISEERFNKAFHATPSALVISRQQDGRIELINDTFVSFFGYSRAEVIGKTSVELGMFANSTDRQAAVQRLQKEGFVRDFELDVRLKSGEVRNASLSVEMIEIGGERMMLTAIQDITLRKRAEKHIAYQARLLATVNDAIVGSDAEFRLTAWNTAAESMYGWKAEEVLGQNGVEILQTQWPQEDANEMRRMIAESGHWRGEATQLRRDGTRIPVEVSSMVLRNERGQVTGYVSVNRDITERKQAEQALRESEQRLKRAQEIAHLGSWELDLRTNRLTWSDEVYRIFGLRPQEFGATYQAFLEAVHPEDRAAVDNAYSSSVREGRDMYEIEHRVVKYSTGEVRIVHEKCEHFRDQNGQIIRSVGMVHDITERKQAEESLRENEERFRFLADSMPQLVWTALANGTVDYYNQRYQEYDEIRRVEDANWDWSPVLHPDDRQSTVKAWQHSVETGEIYQIEHRVQTADGSYRWHLSRGVPVRDETGQIMRWYGTATDIHDLMQAEEQLKVYADRLEQSNRELEEFAFMASHDLQEPLRKIEMFGDMLLERATCLNEQERNYIGRMRNASGRMRDMVEGLLQLSRVTTQGKRFVPVDLSQVTFEVLHDLDGQIRRTNGKVNVENLPTIEGDALQLHQLMQNLIGNALKYHPPGTPPEVHVSAKQFSETVQILVQDNGIGFAQTDAQRIFQPFQRLVGRNSQYEGSGMGLAICRRIVERHGGEISALSQPGHGATFIVTLPIQHS